MTANMRTPSPFTPTDPIAERDRLIGRDSVLDSAVAAVLGGRNLVVSGERGVGKTSLTTVLAHVIRDVATADGAIGATAAFSCSPGSSLEDVTDGVLRSLSRSIDYDLTAPRSVCGAIGVSAGPVRAEIATGIEIHVATTCASRVVGAIADLRRRGGWLSKATVVLIVDEVDQLSRTERPGVFVRTSKEMLAAEGLGPVSFVLVGQRSVVPRLRLEHPSVPRAFEVLWVEPLSIEHCQSIIAKGETDSGIEFDPAIRLVIANTSRGFPAVVQRLADACVAADRDSYVDALDFEDGLCLAIDRIRGEETLYAVTALSGQLGRRILAFLSTRTESVAVSELQSMFPDPKEMVAASVRVLEDGGVVERDDDGIRVTDRLVAAYVSLEETRTRALRDVKELALLFERQGWTVRAVGPEDHRGVDLLAARGRWLFRRRVGAVYVEADRLSEKGISHLGPQFVAARELYGLDEVRLVGRGRVSPAVDAALRRLPGIVYIPWYLLEKGAV